MQPYTPPVHYRASAERLRADGHPTPYNLPSTVVKACAGIVGGVMCGDIAEGFYTQAVAQAEQVIGPGYALNDRAQHNRQLLVRMVKLNLVNRKEYDRELLNRQYGTGITKNQLTAEKRRFCHALAQMLGLA